MGFMHCHGKPLIIRDFRAIALSCLIIAVVFSFGGNLFAQAGPVLVGFDSDYTPNGALNVTVAGDYAYVCTGDSFFVYNVLNPTNPVTVWQAKAPNTAIAISGNYAYANNRASGLTVYDISNPTNVVAVGTNAGYTFISAVAVSSNHLYTANGPDGLRIFDISSPAEPISVGNNATGVSDIQGFQDVVVSKTHAYLHGLHGGIWAFNISDAANPVNVSTIGDSTFKYQNPGRMKISGNYLYISTLTNSLYIYDISNPTNPVTRGKVMSQGGGGGIALSGNYAYLGYDVLGIVDISDPDQPLSLTNTGYPGFDFYFDVAVSGNYAYMAGSGIALIIFSLGSPPPPPLSINLTGGNTVLSWPAPAPAFAAQQITNFNTYVWETLTNTPITAGGTNRILLPTPNGNRFYRLRQP